MDLGLKGKVAVVTGGSVGIGLAVAEGLAAEGVQLVLCARNEARVVEAARTIAAQYGVKAVGVAADVAQASGVDALLRLHDARRGDELHRAGDLLRRLHRPDPAAQDALLPSGHYRWPRSSALRFSSLGCASSLALPSARASR